MKNKHVGLLIVGIAILFFLLIFSFNNALNEIFAATCTDKNIPYDENCPVAVTLRTQKIIGYGLIGLLISLGLFFILHKEKKQTSPNPLDEKDRKKLLENLDEEEKVIINLLQVHEGSLYQSDLIKETNFSKVKMTRILDRLEGKKILERKRRGMTNIVIIR